MSLAKNFILAVLASGLAACGGMEQEESNTTEPVPPPAESQPAEGSEDRGDVSAFAYCTGYDGNNYCLAECNDGINYWYVVGHVSSIPYGDCSSAAYNFCRSYGYSGHNGACWGYP